MNNELIVPSISVGIAFIGLFIAIWQNFLTRKALQAQLVITLEDMSLRANYADGMDAVLSLMQYEGFDTFTQKESYETQKTIYNVVNFLNFVAYLVEDKHMTQQTVWDHYFWAYRMCFEKIPKWWLEGQRKKHPYRFSAFERMCMLVGKVSREQISAFDRKKFKGLPVGT